MACTTATPAAVYQSPALGPTTAAPAFDLEWCLFDRRIALVDFVPPTLPAYSATSNSREVAVSVRYSEPPACSYLQLYTDDEVFRKPCIVAADDDLLLIHMVVAVKGLPKVKYPQHFFIYKTDPDWPCLWAIHPPSHWRGRSDHTGIARSGANFVVASLSVSRFLDEEEVSTVCLYRSSTKKWEIRNIDMPNDMPNKWNTDAVFSYMGHICWIDYHCGILFCNVFSPDPELSFIRLPGIYMWDGDRDLPTMYRTVSLCRGHVKFIDIDNGKFRPTSSDNKLCNESEHNWCKHDYDCKCRIRTWTLKLPTFDWDEDGDLKLSELWSLPKYCTSHLPRTEPTFPVISMDETDIFHFIVKEGLKFWDKSWVITVDMKKKSIRSLNLYKNPVVEGRNIELNHAFLDKPMICSESLKYMKIPTGHCS